MSIWEKLKRGLQRVAHAEPPVVVPDPPDPRRKDPVPEPQNLPPILQDPAPTVRLPKHARKD